MKIDLYTKVILTLIAIFLGVIASKPLAPVPAGAAVGGYGHIQFSGTPPGGTFFDQKNGDLWFLVAVGDHWRGDNWRFDYLGRVEALGKFRPAGSR